MKRPMKIEKRICLICNAELAYNRLNRHLTKEHQITKEQYELQFNLKTYCLCGCGKETKNGIKWSWGHHQRINNISKREDIRAIRREKMQEWHASGTWTPWNKGLTVEDERVKENVKTLTLAINTLEAIQKSSIKMKKQWAEGSIVPITGSNHYNWKGGTSSLVQFLRADWSLYQFWKFPILKRDEFKCKTCKSTKNLTIHHDIEKLCDIMRKFIPEDKHELSYEEKKEIIYKIVQYHVEEKVSGVTLCKLCHKELHKSYNFTDQD